MREELLQVLRNWNEQHGMGAQAWELGKIMQKPRNAVARLLNDCVKQGRVVKIEGDIVRYFHMEYVKKTYGKDSLSFSYTTMSEFERQYDNQIKNGFDRLIGADATLSPIVDMCKIAIAYPGQSIPLLLHGPTGTGKSLIAQLMYEYALSKNVISKEAPFVTMNCSEYANNPELLTANLFGYKKGAFTGAETNQNGWIHAADGGVLFLDEVHCLKAECQEKLFLFMDKGVFHKVGENEKWEKSNVRLVFATTENPEKVLLKTFLRRIPMIVDVPALKERTVSEKVQLIYHFFQKEEEKLNKKIYISNIAYNIFLHFSFDANIGELENTVLVSVARALASSDGERLEVHLSHLPEKMFSLEEDVAQVEWDQKMLSIMELQSEASKEKQIAILYDALIALVKEKRESLSAYYTVIKEYYSKIMYERKEGTTMKNGYLMSRIEQIMKNRLIRYGYQISNKDLSQMFRYIQDAQQKSITVRNWMGDKDEDINLFYLRMKRLFANEWNVAKTIHETIQKQLDYSFDEMFIPTLAINLSLFNQSHNKQRRLGIILAHGYATASSIANTANSLLGEYIFEAIDMEMNASSSEIIDKVNAYLENCGNFEEVILLVDMGSLEQIYEGIHCSHRINIGMVNNITTKIALEIGNGLRNGVNLRTLMEYICENTKVEYQMMESRPKKDAIICACASGIGTAERIRDMISNLLPIPVDLDIVSYDYNAIASQKQNNLLFEKYHVLCIIGTLNPDVNGIPFISMEDLIIGNETSQFRRIMRNYLDEEQLLQFEKKVLHSFSLSNLMQSLTILNPEKLLSHVTKALDIFQQNFSIHIPNAICIGLYLHVCSMIERLVTHQEIADYHHLEQFESENQYFIQTFTESFKEISSFYGIYIPKKELAYIYDYYIKSSISKAKE